MDIRNLRAGPHPDAVRVDRKTKWGNPFIIGQDGTRDEVIEKHKVWFWSKIEAGKISLTDLAALAHRPLACWCAPQPCHAETIAVAAIWAKEKMKVPANG